MNTTLTLVLKQLQQEKVRLSQLQSLYDSQLTDIMHYIQIEEVSEEVSLKLVQKIATIRKERQVVKQDLQDIISVIQKIESTNKTKQKKYNIRTNVLKEFTNAEVLE